jgi:hypothetical protein
MRYILLVILNLFVIFLALLNIVTQYKMGRVSAARFRRQVLLWLAILLVLIGSFPFYNYLTGRPPLDSGQLSAFDIVEITAITYLIYVVNDHRRKIEHNERLIRDLHQELSIRLSDKKGD